MKRSLYILLSTIALGASLSCSKERSSPDYECSYTQELAIVDDFAKSGSVFLFGEKHGTSEAPPFVADFACKIAKDTQGSTIVLLELSIPDILSDLSTESMSIADAQKLILEEDAHWSKGHDGRTSAAMMDAILQILKLREQGLNVALGSIYPDENTKSKYDDLELMFADETTYINRYFQESVQILKYKDEFKNVITLSGKVHTRNHLRFYKKMGLDEAYMGFVQQSGGGSEWNCQPMAGGCKVHSAFTPRKVLVDSSDNASLVLLNKNEDIFDGAFVFKTTSASHPYLKENID